VLGRIRLAESIPWIVERVYETHMREWSHKHTGGRLQPEFYTRPVDKNYVELLCRYYWLDDGDDVALDGDTCPEAENNDRSKDQESDLEVAFRSGGQTDACERKAS